MTEQKSNAAQGLGIAGLVLGILAIPLGIIPCTFWIGLPFGIIGIILSSVALSQANRQNRSKGLIVAALVCSIIGTVFAGVWGLVVGKSADFLNRFENEFEQEMEEAFDTMDEDLEGAFDTMEKDLEESFGKLGEELEKAFEDLEDKNIDIDWDHPEDITEEEFNEFLVAYEKVLKAYIHALEESKEGSHLAVKLSAKMALKTTDLMSKYGKISKKLTEKQAQQLKEVHKKYKDQFEGL